MRGSQFLTLLISASTLAIGAGGAARAADAAPVTKVGELIVTAEKRDEKLRDVPMSVTALPGDTLDKLQDRSFADFAALVPGLTLTPSIPGSSRLTLRGLNAGGVASTVSVYVDESPFGSSTGLVDGSVFAADVDTFDLQRIEVLRGPQGTLYGANSEGGLLKFVTRPPDPTAFHAGVEVGGQAVHDGQTVGSIDGMVNVPVGGKAAFRFAGFYQNLPGWVDDPQLNKRDVNRGSKYGGRASFLLRPSDNVSIRLTAFAEDIRDRGTPQVDVDPVTLAPAHGDLTHDRFIDEPNRFSYRNYNATVNWDLGWANLISTSSYGQEHSRSRQDATALLGGLLSAIFGMPLGALLDQRVTDDKYTEELRLTSTGSRRLDWLFGGFYTHENGLIDQTVPAFNVPSGTPSTLPTLEAASIASTYEEFAGFASATYHFNTAFDLQVGGRYSHNNQSGTENTSGLLLGAPTTFTVPSSENVFNYSVAPRFHLSESTLLYARAANGYRPGGPNVLPPRAPPSTPRFYRPDTTVSYEAGVKSSLFDGRLSVDVAAFLTNWRNVQLIETLNGFAINGNGGGARSTGFEWDATLTPFHGLTLALTGAYTDAHLTTDAPGVGGKSGDRLPWIPRLSATLDGEYDWTAWGDTTAFVGGTWSYVGDRMSDFGAGRTTAPSYDTVNLRAGIDCHRWRLQVYAKNVGDTRGIVNLTGPGAAPGGNRAAIIIQPRTFGVALSTNF